MTNSLETEKISKLLFKFAIPSIIALLVNALYNIVDQIFIGNSIGQLGNAATNVCFPFITITLAIALGIGNGGAAYYSIVLGQKNKEKARKIVINVMVFMFVASIIILFFMKIFFIKLLYLFGATDNFLEYAIDYSSIIITFLPLGLITTGFTAIIRADGSPTYSMYSSFIGAVINTILDPIFIFYFDLGIKGAAYATVIGQAISFVFTISYINRFKMIDLNLKILLKNISVTKIRTILKIFKYGISNFSVQLVMTFVLIILNNVMRYYGAKSIYGADIPISSMGIMMKVSTIVISIIIGFSLGAQPILGYNYGAKNYKRVIETYKKTVMLASIVSVLGFFIFMFGTKYIVALFGKGDDLYMEFIYKSFRIYLLGFFLIGFQIVSSNFFQAIGYPLVSTFLILTRQTIFLIPLLIILPMYFGIIGALFAGPIADITSVILTFFVTRKKILEMRKNV